MQRAITHFQFVRRREQRTADRILADRVRDRALFDHDVSKAFARRRVRRGQTSRAGADDKEIKLISDSRHCDRWLRTSRMFIAPNAFVYPFEESSAAAALVPQTK